MLQHYGVFKPSNRKAASQHQVTQQGQSLLFWGVILILALTTLACGLGTTGSSSRVNRVVILNRLPTLTATPRAAASSGQATAATNTPIASQPLPPTATATPPPGAVSLNISEAPEPISISIETPAAKPPAEAPTDWLFANVQLYPDQYEEGLLLFGEMINNSGVSQTPTELTGIFYDAQGQVIADADNTIGYWPVDNIPPEGRVPFELLLEGIHRVANFDLNVTAEPGDTIPRQDFEFGDLNQRTEADTYCLTGQFRNPGAELQNYLVIGATLYDAQNNVVNFGDYYQPDLQAMAADQPLQFEICITPPNQGATRYEVWAWGE